MSGVATNFVKQLTDGQLFDRYEKLDRLYGACLNTGNHRSDFALDVWDETEKEMVRRNLIDNPEQ